MTVDPFDRRILEEGDTASSNPAADHADQLQRVPIIQGRLITIEFPSGTTAAVFNHGLGRRYIGAIEAGTASTLRIVRVATPGLTDASPDGDAAINVFADISSDPGVDLSYSLWVF